MLNDKFLYLPNINKKILTSVKPFWRNATLNTVTRGYCVVELIPSTSVNVCTHTCEDVDVSVCLHVCESPVFYIFYLLLIFYYYCKYL